METTFTRTERLLSGLYTAGFAAAGVFLLFFALPGLTDGRPFILLAMAGGFLGGSLVIPAILIPDQFSLRRAIAAGCLATLGSSLFSAIILALLHGFAINSSQLEVLSQDLNFNSDFSLQRFWEALLQTTPVCLTLSLPYCLIGAPATIALSSLITKHRDKEPKISLEIFE